MRCQSLVLGLVLFDIFNDLDEEVEQMLKKFAGGTKLDRIANALEGRNNLAKLEKWTKNNLTVTLQN